MADIFRMATKGKVWLIGSGRTRLNPIHGADLADVIASALGAQQPEAEVAVGGPDVLTQREIAELALPTVFWPDASLRPCVACPD